MGVSFLHQDLLCLLCEIEGCYSMLSHGLLVLCIQLWILFTDNFPDAHLRHFLRHEFFIEHSLLYCLGVLDYRRYHLVDIILTDSLGLLTFWLS